jgi:hypothetical protein
MIIQSIIGIPNRNKSEFGDFKCSHCGKPGGWWQVRIREERFKKGEKVSEAIVTLKVCAECVQLNAGELLQGFWKGEWND